MASKWAKIKANVVQERSPPPKLLASVQEAAARHSWSKPPPWVTAGSRPTSAITSPANDNLYAGLSPQDAASPLYTNIDPNAGENVNSLAEEKSITDSWQRSPTPPLFDVDIAMAADDNGPTGDDSFVANTTLASQDTNFDGDLSVGSDDNSTGGATYAVDEHLQGEAEYTEAHTQEVEVDHEGDVTATSTSAAPDMLEGTPVVASVQPASLHLSRPQNTVSFADGSSPGDHPLNKNGRTSSLGNSNYNTTTSTTNNTVDAFQNEPSPAQPQRLRGGARSGPFIDTPAVAKQPLGMTPLAPSHRVSAHVPFVKTPFVAKQPLELAFSPATSAAFQTTMAATASATIPLAMTTAAVSTGLYSDTVLLDALRTTATFNTPTTKASSPAPFAETMEADEARKSELDANEEVDVAVAAEVVSNSETVAGEMINGEPETEERRNNEMETMDLSSELAEHSMPTMAESQSQESSKPSKIEVKHATDRNDFNDGVPSSVWSANLPPASTTGLLPQLVNDNSIYVPADERSATAEPSVAAEDSSVAVGTTSSVATDAGSSAELAVRAGPPPSSVTRPGVQVPAKDRGPPPWLAPTSTSSKQRMSSSLPLSPSPQNSGSMPLSTRDEESLPPNSVGDLYTHAISSSSDDDETDEEAERIFEEGANMEDKEEGSVGEASASNVSGLRVDTDSPRSMGGKSSNKNGSSNASQTQVWLSTAMNRTNVHDHKRHHKKSHKSSKNNGRGKESVDPLSVGWAAAAPDTDEATRLRYFLSLAEPTTKTSAAAAAAKKAATHWRAAAKAKSGRALKDQSAHISHESTDKVATASAACPLCFLTLEDPQPLDGCGHVICGPCKRFAIMERGLPSHNACPRCPAPPLLSPVDAAARVLAIAAAQERTLEANALHHRRTTTIGSSSSSSRPATTGTWNQGRSLPLAEKEDPRPLSQRSRQRRREAAEEAARKAAAIAATQTAERAHRRATFLFLPVWRRLASDSLEQDGSVIRKEEKKNSSDDAAMTQLNWAELPPVLSTDLATAQALLKEAAELGHVHAQYALSVAYQQGQGFDSSTRASRRASLHWACRAATQGHARAQLVLGVACENGVEGVALPDLPRAVGWFRAAAEQGIPQAQLNLGVCLWQGRGVRRPDPSAAVAWFTRAAAAGLAAAQFNLGVACWRGGWLEAAPIVVDDPKVGEGASSLGDYNRNHRRESGHQRQHRRSNRVEEDLGCLTGDVKSRSSTAKLTASSRVHIMPPNAAVAVGWFEKAAMQGDAQAQYNLAGCYKNGEGVPRCMGLACYWWSRAATRIPDAAANLGAALWNGEVPAPLSSTHSYNRGSGSGTSSASEKAARRAAAVGWYRCAAEQGHAVAQRHLADALLTSAATPTSSSSSSTATSSSSSSSSSGGSSSSNTQRGAMQSTRYAGTAATEVLVAEVATAVFEDASTVTGDQPKLSEEEQAQPTPSLEAAKWYAAAAEQGDAPAAYSLGVLYETGLGSDAPDLERATEWHQRAARLGFRASEESLATLVPALAASKKLHASCNSDAQRSSHHSIEEEEEDWQEPALSPLPQSSPMLTSTGQGFQGATIEKGWLTAEEAAKSMAAALAKIRLAES